MSRDPIGAVFFDFAGTLFSDRALRDVHLEQLRFVARASGGGTGAANDVALRAAYKRGIGVASRTVGTRPTYSHRDLFATAFKEMAVALDGGIDDDIAHEAVDRQYHATIEHAVLRDDVIATLDDLRARGVHTQVVSNIDDEQLQPMIRRFGLDSALDAWTSSEEAGSCKPHARIFEYALSKAGCAAAASLFVGDSVAHDVAGAAAAGMTTAWLLADAKPGLDEHHTADHEITTLREVIAIVDGRAQPLERAQRSGRGGAA
jgi:HAD superfamily hydrolase (TIGR01509 family)